MGLDTNNRSVSGCLCAGFILLGLFPFAASGLTATPLETDSTISSGVDSKFTFATGANAGKPGGIVGVALDGELVFQRAYGMADV